MRQMAGPKPAIRFFARISIQDKRSPGCCLHSIAAALRGSAVGRARADRQPRTDRRPVQRARSRQPDAYVGVLTSPLFGRANAARPPRTAQVALRYRF